MRTVSCWEQIAWQYLHLMLWIRIFHGRQVRLLAEWAVRAVWFCFSFVAGHRCSACWLKAAKAFLCFRSEAWWWDWRIHSAAMQQAWHPCKFFQTEEILSTNLHVAWIRWVIFDTPIDLSRLGNLLDIRCILRIVLINNIYIYIYI